MDQRPDHQPARSRIPIRHSPAPRPLPPIVHTIAITVGRVCARHHAIRLALGSDRRVPLGSLRHRLHADRRARRRVQSRGRDAQLARRCGLQAGFASAAFTSTRERRSIRRRNRSRSAPAPPICRPRRTGPTSSAPSGISRTAGFRCARRFSRPTKLNAREPDPTNPLLERSGRNAAREWRAVGSAGPHLTSRWDMLASYANLDGKVISSNYYPAAIGAQLANVPRNTFNFWSTLPSAVALGNRRGRQLCFQPHRQFHRAVRSSHRTGEGSPRLLGVQRDGEASAHRACRSADQRQQHCQPLLLRRTASRRTSCWDRAARR